ncbi:MAG TPA: hypothetical protein VD947_02120 [Patescibacteria group bacterium]|nr:hypothetical protein [Patescibacteria group bacterium]
MIHAISYILFILPFTAWLGFELKRKYSLSQHRQWLMAAFTVGIIGWLTYKINYDIVGNFLLHASGGVASTLLFVYVLKTLRLHFPWRLTLVLLFAFVCMLGVMNELAEYFFEFFGLGPFAFDIHDTWRDFVANTTGALTAWAVINMTPLRKDL